VTDRWLGKHFATTQPADDWQKSMYGQHCLLPLTRHHDEQPHGPRMTRQHAPLNSSLGPSQVVRESKKPLFSYGEVPLGSMDTDEYSSKPSLDVFRVRWFYRVFGSIGAFQRLLGRVSGKKK